MNISKMDKSEIIQILEEDYGTSIPSEVPETERIALSERLRFELKPSPDYSKQLVTISEALEL